MTTMQTMEDCIKAHIEFAKSVLVASKRFDPMAIGFNSIERKKYVFALLWKDDRDKYRMINALKKSAFSMGITRWIFLSEAWIKVCKNVDKIDMTRRVSTYPDKKECMIISGHGLLEKSLMAHFTFEKVNDEMRFGEIVWIQTDESGDHLWGDAFNESWFHKKG